MRVPGRHRSGSATLMEMTDQVLRSDRSPVVDLILSGQDRFSLRARFTSAAAFCLNIFTERPQSADPIHLCVTLQSNHKQTSAFLFRLGPDRRVGDEYQTPDATFTLRAS